VNFQLGREMMVKAREKNKKQMKDANKNLNQKLHKKVKEAILKLREIASENEHLYEELHQLLFNIARAFATAVEAKDPFSKGHTERVAKYALIIARELPASFKKEMNSDSAMLLRLTALLHDIGKIGVREDILDKEGALTDKEWEEIKKHPQTGSAILEPIHELKEVARDIKHHHERIDGKGYPEGLKKGEIPLVSRIIAVADAFEAMTAERPYRRKISKKAAIEELKRCRGTQFDKDIVEAFIRAYKKGKIQGT